MASIAACRAPAGEWEFVLIDNNSIDDTRVIGDAFVGRLPLRYVFEPEQGLSVARNRALFECRGDALLYTDDDLEFDTDWLVRYEQAFSAESGAGWFGGRILPHWDEEPPRWVRDESIALISGLLGRYDLGDQDRGYENADPTPFGASFGLRRSAFQEVGLFRTDLGVRGDVPGRGEETEYFQRLKLAGIPGFYVGSARAWHRQDPARFRWGFLYRYGIQKGIAAARMGASENRASIGKELLFGIRGLVQLTRGRGDRFRQCVINMGIQRGRRIAAETQGCSEPHD